MKRLYLAAGILAGMLSLSLWNVWYLHRTTGEILRLLSQMEAYVQSENIPTAQLFADRAMEQWERHRLYYHVVLCHEDTDSVEADFQEVLTWLNSDETEEFSAAAAQLKTEIFLLWENERPLVENVL